jgi:hypothetical protein
VVQSAGPEIKFQSRKKEKIYSMEHYFPEMFSDKNKKLMCNKCSPDLRDSPHIFEIFAALDFYFIYVGYYNY